MHLIPPTLTGTSLGRYLRNAFGRAMKTALAELLTASLASPEARTKPPQRPTSKPTPGGLRP